MNPRQTIQFSERLKDEHEPLVETKDWLAANEKLMQKIGTSERLWLLLDVLESGGILDI
jgi:pyruvate dehydrogenase complex dehydrogenase (E1) component